MSKLSLLKTFFLVGVLCTLPMISSAAQTFKSLLSFDGSNGSNLQYGPLVQGLNGNYYGTAYESGAHGAGTVFEVTAAGKLTTLYNFCAKTSCDDGSYPVAGLILATNGNFYGTTVEGGTKGYGTVFEITAGGALTTVHSFASTDGSYPYSGLVQAANGNFYGTTSQGGTKGYGTVFQLTSAGKLTTLHSFVDTDGSSPIATLIQATNGTLYGTTAEGGKGNGGTVFDITTAGKLTTLYNFCSKASCTDGFVPYGQLAQATNGNFYGTTEEGGTGEDGTAFDITTAGKLTTLVSLDGTNGYEPFGGLVQATNGNLYGTTKGGGTDGDGTIFELTTAGKLTTLFSFEATNGEYPLAGLLQATSGIFYGTTAAGGSDNDGTVYSLSEGLGPFIETLPTSGAVGAAVTILGNNLTGATSVTFNGKAATFRVVSSTEITTTVPSGATTGKVVVKTSTATLSSNVNFQVT